MLFDSMFRIVAVLVVGLIIIIVHSYDPPMYETAILLEPNLQNEALIAFIIIIVIAIVKVIVVHRNAGLRFSRKNFVECISANLMCFV